jgi:hypothetical protein
VFLVGLFRREETIKGGRLSANLRRALKDTAFFGLLFVLFIQIWITTSVPMSGFFRLDPGMFLKHLLKSIANLAWHYDTSYLIRSLNQHWPLFLIVASLAVSAILFYYLFVIIAKRGATGPNAGSSVSYLDMVLVLAVFGALVAPTVLLESTTATWFPGVRVTHGPTGFSARPLSVDYFSPDRIFISANGTWGRACAQCKHRIVMRLLGRSWSGVQPRGFGTIDV